MRVRIILLPRELLCATKRQCPLRSGAKFLSRFEFLDAFQFLVNALDGGDENLFALRCVLCCSGKATASRFGLSFRLALPMSREGTLLVVNIPKPRAKALKPVARHFPNGGMMAVADQFLLVMLQNADFELAGSRHRILLFWAVEGYLGRGHEQWLDLRSKLTLHKLRELCL
jgi:hypothetical protein